jgi:hypothetical protein
MIVALATLVALAVPSLSAQLDTGAVLLDEYAPCGQTSLYLVCRLRSINVSFNQIQNLTGPADGDGYHSFADLARAAEKLDLRPVAVHVDRKRLMASPTPAIIHMHVPGGTQHLSVLLATSPEGATILDAPYPANLVPWSLFEHFWTGNALLFPSSDFENSTLESLIREPIYPWLWSFNLTIGAASVLGLLAWGAISWRRNLRVRGDLRTLQTPEPVRTTGFAAAAGNIFRFLRRRDRTAFGCMLLMVAGGLTGAAISKGFKFVANVPRLVIDSPIVDVGEFAPGEYKTTITLHNKGRQELQITKVESSCSCAVVKKPDVIAPHSSAELKVTFNVTPGRGFANLALHSNDPNGLGDVTLQWHGTAQPMLLPRCIEAGGAPLGSTYERIVSIVYPGGRSAIAPVVRQVDCESDKLKMVTVGNDPVAFRTATDASNSRAVGYLNARLTVESPAKAGTTTAVALITVGYGDHDYTLRLPVRVRFKDLIAAEPDGAAFSAVGPKEFENESRSIKLVGTSGGEQLTVSKCPDWLRCELLERHDGDPTLLMTAIQAPAESVTRETVELRSSADPNFRLSIAVSSFVQTPHSLFSPN